MRKNEKGFGVVEILLIIVVIGLLGLVGWRLFNMQKDGKTSGNEVSNTQNSEQAKTAQTPKQPDQLKDPYDGWKTYISSLGSGLTFKYPADWYFPDATENIPSTPNNLGGREADHVLKSVEPTFSKPIPAGGVSTNQYLCLSIDEYTGNGWGYSKWQTSPPASNNPLTINGKTVDFGLFAGSSPMLSKLYINNPDHPSGDHFITTKDGYVVAIKAAFNDCQQSGGEAGIKNLQADFMQQPEVKTAQLIIQSIRW